MALKLYIVLVFLVIPFCAIADNNKPVDFQWPAGTENAIEIKDASYQARLEQTKKDIADLKSSDKWIREFAQRRILDTRDEIISGLVKSILDEKSDKSFNRTFYRAVKMLGRYRAAEGVYALASKLTYLPSKGDYVPPVEGEYEAYYPCAAALVSIGQPAIDEMVKKVGGSENEQEKALAAWVVVKIDGKEQAAFQFEHLAKDMQDIRWHTNFMWAKDYATNYIPNHGNPYVKSSGDKCKSDLTSQVH